MKERKKEKEKKRKSIIESEIMSIVQKSLKQAVDMAMADIFKEWK